MSMYYLHRDAETTGPFAEGRLRQMLTAGEIGPDELVCAHGTEDWIPASYVVTAAPVPVKAPTGIRKTRPYNRASWLLALSGLAALFLLPLIIGVGLCALLVIAGVVIDRPRYICPTCGNRVERTSVICPTCSARLS